MHYEWEELAMLGIGGDGLMWQVRSKTFSGQVGGTDNVECGKTTADVVVNPGQRLSLGVCTVNGRSWRC